VWENVDHILYAFPSGIAELCERHGLVLAEAATTVESRPSGVWNWLRTCKLYIRGTRYITVGYRSLGPRGTARVKQSRAAGVVRVLSMRHDQFHRRMLGETSLYVIRRR